MKSAKSAKLEEETRMAATLDVVDKRICKAPKAYDGKREKWRHFKVGLMGYVSAVSSELKEMMRIAETLGARPLEPSVLASRRGSRS